MKRAYVEMNQRISTDVTGNGPEMSALLVSRQWFFIAMTFLAVVVGSLADLSDWGQLSNFERGITVTAVALFVAGIAFRRSIPGLWLLVLAATTYFSNIFIADQTLVSPSMLSSSVAIVVFAFATLLPRGPAIAAIITFPIVMQVTWLEFGGAGLEGWYGWLLVTQRILSGFIVLFAWRHLVRESQLQDGRYFHAQRQWETALQMRMREEARRTFANRVHEVNLNVHRVLLSGGDPSSPGFQQHLASMQSLAKSTREEFADPDSQSVTPENLSSLIRSAFTGDEELRMESRETVEGVPSIEYDILRSAIFELVRNECHHGAARKFVLKWRVDYRGLTVVLTASGGGRLRQPALPGMGRSRTLGVDLVSIGGTLTEKIQGSETVYKVTIPLRKQQDLDRRSFGQDQTAPSSSSYFSKSRLLLSAAIVGGVLMAPIYALLLFLSGTASFAVAILGMAMAVPIIWIVVRREQLRPSAGIFSMIIPAAVPWVSIAVSAGLIADPGLARLVSLASYAVFLIGIWSNVYVLATGFIIWASGVFVLVTTIDGLPWQDVLSAMPTSILGILPIGALLFIYSRRYAKVSETMSAISHEIARENARSAASAEVQKSFAVLLQDNADLVGQIMKQGFVDERSRREIRIMDARLRAAIFVDTLASGGLSALASDVVSGAAERGTPITVRAIQSSADQRPVSQDVARRLISMAVNTHGETPTIYGFTNGEVDHLVLGVDVSAATREGLSVGDSVEIGDVSLTVELDDDPQREVQRCLIHIERPCVGATEGGPRVEHADLLR
jgi:hypothetical protein